MFSIVLQIERALYNIGENQSESIYPGCTADIMTSNEVFVKGEFRVLFDLRDDRAHLRYRISP